MDLDIGSMDVNGYRHNYNDFYENFAYTMS